MSRHDYHVYDVGDNGEFINWAKVDLVTDGELVDTIQFTGTTEEPCPSGAEQAHSQGREWVRHQEVLDEAERTGRHPLEISLQRADEDGEGDW